jgi:hypothetical protein
MFTLFTKKKAVDNRAFLQVFISYARKEKAFVDQLAAGLQQKEYKTWIDTKDILPSTQWLQVILDAIERSAVFLMIITEDSLYSDICLKELKQATDLGKKIIPLVYGDIKEIEMPEALRPIQWVSWEKEATFDANMERLQEAILADLDWHILHTTIAAQAHFWKKNNETNDILLRGNMLLNSEAWIDDSIKDKGKRITADQKLFILKSRRYIARQNLLPLLNGFILVVVLSMVLQQMQGILKTPATPLGLLNLELAGSRETTESVLAAWKESGLIETASNSILVDFFFVYTYLLFFIFSLRYFKIYFKRRKKLLSNIAAVLIGLAIVVAFFDVLENIFLLLLLNGIHVPGIFTQYMMSILKFILIYVCVFYLLISVVYSTIFRKKIESIEIIG